MSGQRSVSAAAVAFSLAFNPSGDLLAGADLGNGGSLSSVNGTTATEAGSFVSDLGEISVAFSPSNGMLASANALDSTVSLYSISGTTATSIGSVPSTSLNFPFAVAFSPSGDLLAVANAGNDTVSLFSMEDQSPTLVGAPLAVSGSPQSVAFSPSGDLLAVADTSTNSVSVFSIDGTTATPIEPDLDTGEDSSPTSVAFSPSGDLLATANETSDTVSLFTVANDTVTPLGSPLPVGDEPFAVAFSPSGGMLATANDAVSAGGAISVFSVGPPSATIDMPAGGGTYGLGQAVPTTFSCVDAPYTTGLDACTDSNGDSSGGGGLFTGTLGTHTYTVTATSKDGQTASTRISYTVVPDPTATITAPGSGGTYTVGQNVTTGFSCAEGAGGPGLSSCGDSTGGSGGTGTLDTSTLGTHTYTVTATSQDGAVGTTSIDYSVVAPTTTSTPNTPPPVTVTSTVTTPITTTPATVVRSAPSAAKLSKVSAGKTVVVTCKANGTGCKYKIAQLRFSLNRAATVHLVFRVRDGKRWRQLATTNIRGRKGASKHEIAGRWKGKAGSVRSAQLLVEIKYGARWSIKKTIGLKVRHARA